MPSMLMAMVQGVVSSLPLNLLTAVLLTVYCLARTGSLELALFTGAAHFLVACYVTLVRGISAFATSGSSTPDANGNRWSAAPSQ